MASRRSLTTCLRHGRRGRDQRDAAQAADRRCAHLHRPAVLRQHRLLGPLRLLLRLAAPLAARASIPTCSARCSCRRPRSSSPTPTATTARTARRSSSRTASGSVFARAREAALADFPITVYYAFKQSDADDDGTASTGWETLLDGMIRVGLGDHRDLADAQRARRPDDRQSARTPSPRRSSSRCARAPTTRRRPTAAASSPRCTTSCPTRCASCSRARSRRSTCRRPRSARAWRCSRATRRCIETDGSTMTVRSALARINEILDQVLNEQEGDFDATTRFAIAWYRQHGYGDRQVRRSPTTSRAPATPRSRRMDRDGILTSARRQGHAALSPPICRRTTTCWPTTASARGRYSTT